MNFSSASSILTSIGQMQWANQVAQGNRAKINRLFNGEPPWTEAERKLNRISTNQNWLEATRIATNSRAQIENAFTQPGNFFDIRVKRGPTHLRDKYSACLTTYINDALRRDPQRRYVSSRNQAFAQVVLHGPGPQLWRNRRSPAPSPLGVDDVLVPAGTLADMSNLDYLSIYREWTWAQLWELTHGPAVDKGWNMPYINQLLSTLYDMPLQSLYQGNRWLFPEKIAEDMKENSATWGSSALGRVLAWDFYYRNDATGKWNRRILLDYNNTSPTSEKRQSRWERIKTEAAKKPDFLYTRENYADEWQEIIHWFVGNCSNVAPFRYYSVRSIGYLLYGVSLIQNTMRCRLTDHILQQLLTWFRNVGEDDREQLENIELQHMGIFPAGVSLVGASDRYEADWNLVSLGLQQNRQLMAESATSFLPDIAVEGQKPEMTATESIIRNNASVTLTSAVLSQLKEQHEPLAREICRRFCLKDNPDPMAKRVREQMKEDDIPLTILDERDWEIDINMALGGGNPAVRLTTARALFESFAESRTAKYQYALALTNDSDMAEEIVPMEPQVSDSSVLAQLAFGTLMEGVPVMQKKGINEAAYIETLIELMARGMAPLEQLQEQPAAMAVNAERIAGLVNVGNHIEQHIQVFAQDGRNKEKARDAQRVVNQLMGQLQAYAQRLNEMEQAAQQQQGGLSPEAQAKIQSMIVTAQAKGQIDVERSQHKLQLKDAEFLATQQRKDAETVAEMRRKDALTAADVAAKDINTRADLIHTQATHEQTTSHSDEAHSQEKQHAQEKAAVDIQTTKEKSKVAVETAKQKAAAQAKAAKARPKAATKAK